MDSDLGSMKRGVAQILWEALGVSPHVVFQFEGEKGVYAEIYLQEDIVLSKNSFLKIKD